MVPHYGEKLHPRQLWDYGLQWVAETVALTYSSAGSMDGNIPLQQVTGYTPDHISEYLDFGIYDPVWFKDNTGTSPFEH